MYCSVAEKCVRAIEEYREETIHLWKQIPFIKFIPKSTEKAYAISDDF